VGTRTLVVAGNAHTPTRRSRLGVPLGACLARQRPGVREIRINYRSGQFYNIQPRRFSAASPGPGPARLYQRERALMLDLAVAREAVVPQRHPATDFPADPTGVPPSP
jgi:hypothetical protein